MFLRSARRKDLPDWSSDEIRDAVLAIYQHFEATGGVQHYRTAFLLRYDLRLLPPDAVRAWVERDPPRQPPRFKVYTVEIGGNESADSLGETLHDSLEAARTECVEWAGEAREVDWAALTTMTVTELFAVVRDPSVVERYSSAEGA